MNKANIVWAILTHEPADAVKRMIHHWSELGCERIVIIYGGSFENYKLIKWNECYFVDGDRHRTHDHQRERQSYKDVFKTVLDKVDTASVGHIYFTEFDQVPLDSRFLFELELRARKPACDVYFSGLKRVDGTNHAIWLNHQYSGELFEEMEACSVRADKRVYSAYGFGQLWSIEAFRCAAAYESDAWVYLELWFPTLAYHLGFSIGELGVDRQFNSHLVLKENIEDLVISKIACVVHPVKKYWRG